MKRRVYDRQFKMEAVRLALPLGIAIFHDENARSMPFSPSSFSVPR